MADSTLKLNIPSIAPRGSETFAQALKVCLAAAAYNVNVQCSKVAGQNESVSLELPQLHKSLIEANAIVRYFAAVGASPWPFTANSRYKDLALAEWEESFLRSAVKARKPDDYILNTADNIISKSGFPGSVVSPAEIIIFSTIYDAVEKAPPDLLSLYPSLKGWFIGLLDLPWAKTGIERAAAQTSELPLEPSPAQGKPETAFVQNVKEEAKMIIPEPGQDILPKPGQKNILITSALPYVNNVPHLGNIIGSVLSADVFARYHKARNDNTLYMCGTDEYGTATETKALEEKCSPQELCDKYHVLHRDIYKWFDIGFDYFGRTTTPKQTEIAQSIFLKLHKNGYLSDDSMTQLYCEKHDGFLADRFVEGTCPKCLYEDARGDQCDKCGTLLDPFDLINPRCKIDGHSPIPRDSRHIFLQLEKLQPIIEEWSKKASEEGGWSRNGRIITEAWLKEGLRPRCITRDLKWGVPVPLEGFEKKVLYVWFEACIGYISITANYTKDWEKWWHDPDNVKLFQFMGKDNVPFHTVIFPGCQLGTNDSWTKLHHISTTEYLQYEYGKFSKSRGVGVFGDNARDTGIPPSVWRYYLLSSRPETGDTQFVWKDFVTKNNSELLANFGNFVNRVIKFTNAKYSSVVPDYTKASLEVLAGSQRFRDDVDKLLAEYVDELENVHLRAGLDKFMAISGRGNQFLQDNKLDNNLFANSSDTCAAVVGTALNLIYLLSALVYPYMPAIAHSIVEQLNAPLRRIPNPNDGWMDLLPGHVIGKAAYLFSRIDEKKAEEWKARYGGKQVMAEGAPQPGAGKKDKRKEKKEGEAPVRAPN
ncbi:tRNA synthetases class I (M)-domain-containing protein [Kalaharituber pfeilii]|nr:tRNA synthetases class I (M)-domain-containing protein [Kalaharituber pfeilii]